MSAHIDTRPCVAQVSGAPCGGEVDMLTSTCLRCKARVLAPQPGPQTKFLECSADVAGYGGAANSGKSVCLLLDALQYVHIPGWTGAVFRRHATDYSKPGNIFDKAARFFAGTGARVRSGNVRDFTWPSGARLSFQHLDDQNLESYQGAELAWAGFDEFTHFEMRWFRWIMTRMRTHSGARWSIRLTFNPDPDHEIAEWVEPYLNPPPGPGTPDPAKSGTVRFFASSRETDRFVFGDTRDECARLSGRPASEVKSFAFFAATMADNAIGRLENPDYEGNLAAETAVKEAQLRYGDWRARAEHSGMLRREWWGTCTEPLAPIVLRIRSWDKAATKPKAGSEPWHARKSPDFTVGVLVEFDAVGRAYVSDLVACRSEPPEVEMLMAETAARDGAGVIQAIQRDPAAAGKSDVLHTQTVLASSGTCGRIEITHPHTDKLVRVQPLSTDLRLGMSGTGGVRMPRWYVRDTGWLARSYSDPALTTTLGDLFWRLVARFFDATEHDDIPDALAAAREVQQRIASQVAQPSAAERMRATIGALTPGRR